jgi:hypothetical protein
MGGRCEKFKTFHIPRAELSRTLAIVYRKPRALRPAALALIELLEKHFRAKPGEP